jgi:hypothetical protein
MINPMVMHLVQLVHTASSQVVLRNILDIWRKEIQESKGRSVFRHGLGISVKMGSVGSKDTCFTLFSIGS